MASDEMIEAVALALYQASPKHSISWGMGKGNYIDQAKTALGAAQAFKDRKLRDMIKDSPHIVNAFAIVHEAYELTGVEQEEIKITSMSGGMRFMVTINLAVLQRLLEVTVITKKAKKCDQCPGTMQQHTSDCNYVK